MNLKLLQISQVLKAAFNQIETKPFLGYEYLGEQPVNNISKLMGYQMMLKFSLPNHSQPFTLKGKIDWSGPRGFGVEFDEMTPQQGGTY